MKLVNKDNNSSDELEKGYNEDRDSEDSFFKNSGGLEEYFDEKN